MENPNHKGYGWISDKAFYDKYIRYFLDTDTERFLQSLKEVKIRFDEILRMEGGLKTCKIDNVTYWKVPDNGLDLLSRYFDLVP